ncbi:methyltransferase domain-containing protein [Kitasatospora sp. NPDC001159]
MTLLNGPELAAAFDRSSGAYDRLTSLYPGYHSRLRRAAALAAPPGPAARLLDLGCGTGASTRALLAAVPSAMVTAIDASAGMLEQARAKPWPPAVAFAHLSAEDVGRAPANGPFDAVFAAYLIRNTADPDAVLHAARRVLRPGGRLVLHDYTLRGRPLDRATWTLLCRAVIIPLGSTGPGGPALYRHLHRSVLDFDTAPALARRVQRAGFIRVRVHPAPGWQRGVVHTLTAERPEEGP